MNRRNEMGGVRVDRMQYRRWGLPLGRRLMGTRMEVPPPFSILQASRGEERRIISWQVEPGGGWRCAGALG